MFNLDVTQKCLIAECWCAIADLDKIQLALRRGTVSGINVSFDYGKSLLFSIQLFLYTCQYSLSHGPLFGIPHFSVPISPHP